MQIWNQNIHKRIIREPNASYAISRFYAITNIAKNQSRV